MVSIHRFGTMKTAFILTLNAMGEIKNNMKLSDVQVFLPGHPKYYKSSNA